MDRRSQQNHIRAARDWLGRAEDSLARENDVQGDLKLMLAKAELAHVGQSSRSRTILLWGRRIAALLVAAFLAGAYWQPSANVTVTEEPVIRDEHMTAASSQQAVTQESSSVIAEPATEPSAEPKSSAAQLQERPAPQMPESPAYRTAPEPVQESTVVQAAPEPAAQPKLPDTAKQQLMQSAGKILRQ